MSGPLPTNAILALEASGAACSVAVMGDDSLLAQRQQPMDRGHAEVLMPLVMDAMSEAGIAFADLATVLVSDCASHRRQNARDAYHRSPDDAAPPVVKDDRRC